MMAFTHNSATGNLESFTPESKPPDLNIVNAAIGVARRKKSPTVPRTYFSPITNPSEDGDPLAPQSGSADLSSDIPAEFKSTRPLVAVHVVAPEPLIHALAHILQGLQTRQGVAAVTAQYKGNQNQPTNQQEEPGGNLQFYAKEAIANTLKKAEKQWKTIAAYIGKQRQCQDNFHENTAVPSWKPDYKLLVQANITSPQSCCGPKSVVQEPENQDQPSFNVFVRAINRLLGGHSHEHGTVLIDVDEAVHALWALCKQLGAVVQGKPKEVIATLKADALHLKEHPLQDPGQHILPKAVPDFALSMVLNVAMSVFAFLAIKAGWGEWQHANEAMPQLQARLRKVQAWVSKVAGAATQDALKAKGVVGAMHQAWQHQVQSLKTAIALTHADKRIGQASFGSGIAILAKSLMDIGTVLSLMLQASAGSIRKGFDGFHFVNTALGGASKLAAGTGAAGLTTTVVGLAGSVLAPIAGAGATYMGLKLRAKANMMLKRYAHFESTLAGLHQIHGALKERANIKRTNDAAKATEPMTKLLAFVQRQHNKRVGFFAAFKQKMNWFTGGSLAYTIVSLAKVAGVVLLVLGVAGVVGGIFSNPISAGVFLAVAIVAGLAMLYGGTGLLFGHPKQAKYCEAVSAESHWIDKNTLVQLQHLHHLEGEVQGNEVASIQHDAGTYMVSCLKQLDTYKEGREAFLQALVNANLDRQRSKLNPFSACKAKTPTMTPKMFIQCYGLRKKLIVLTKTNPQAGVGEKTWTVLKALPAYLATKLRGVVVGENDVSAFAQTDAGQQAFLDFTQTYLLAENQHLQTQIALRLRVVAPLSKEDLWQDIENKSPQDALVIFQNTADILGNQDEQLRQNLAQLEKNLDCQNDLQHNRVMLTGTSGSALPLESADSQSASASTSSATTTSALEAFKQSHKWDESVEKFLKHMGMHEAFESAHASIADWMHNDLDAELRTARGVLFDGLASVNLHATTLPSERG